MFAATVVVIVMVAAFSSCIAALWGYDYGVRERPRMNTPSHMFDVETISGFVRVSGPGVVDQQSAEELVRRLNLVVIPKGDS